MKIMTSIQQEIAQLQAEFEGLVTAWNGLTHTERKREWNAYLDLTDQGGAGWHRFAMLLINSFCEGWCPVEGMVRSSAGELRPAQSASA